MEAFKLPYLDALAKSLEIVKKDGLHIDNKNGEFAPSEQIENLINVYENFDPDSTFTALHAIEHNKNVLKEEVRFIIKLFLNEQRWTQHVRSKHFADQIRLRHLSEKYKLSHENGYNVSPIFISFPKDEYDIKKENPNLSKFQPEELKKYKNFKREYDVDGILGLLPPGKKYGGFLKVILHMKLVGHLKKNPELVFFGKRIFQQELGECRAIYNSKTYSNEERNDWFGKLGIQDKDCALWTRVFDEQYPGYKDVHKFFEQVA